MKKLLFILVLVFFGGIQLISQREIKSRIIRLNIPSKGHMVLAVDSINPKPVGVDFPENFTRIISEEYSHVTTEVFRDTTLNQDKKEVHTNFRFLPGQFSEKPIDFPPGGYLLDSAKISEYFVRSVSKILRERILQMADSSSMIIIRIKGTADAVSVRKIRYKGEFGDMLKSDCRLNNEVFSVEISTGKFIRSNIQLAFLRTYGVRKYFENQVDQINNRHISYEHELELFDKVGSDFRTINVTIVLKEVIQ